MIIDNDEIARSQKWKDRVWCREVLNDHQYRFLEQTIPIVKSIYKEDWDLEFEFETIINSESVMRINDYGYSYLDYQDEPFSKLKAISFLIHFPDFMISNRDGATHNIKDLYVKLLFSCKESATGVFSFEVAKPKGVRATITKREYVCMYVHSHLPSKSYNSREDRPAFNKFCLGSGGMNNAYSMVRSGISEAYSGNNYTINIAMFRLYLLQLKDYVQWESIEGGPYNFISYLYGRKVISEGFVPNDDTNDTIYNSYIGHYNSDNLPDINWKIVNNNFVVVDNEKFEKSFKAGTLMPASLCFLKDPSGRMFQGVDDRDTLSERAASTHTTLFTYKGRTIRFNVIDTPPEYETQIEKKYCIHPFNKNYVKSKLESTVNKKALIRSCS